jgi:hypothetical protein
MVRCIGVRAYRRDPDRGHRRRLGAGLVRGSEAVDGPGRVDRNLDQRGLSVVDQPRESDARAQRAAAGEDDAENITIGVAASRGHDPEPTPSDHPGPVPVSLPDGIGARRGDDGDARTTGRGECRQEPVGIVDELGVVDDQEDVASA